MSHITPGTGYAWNYPTHTPTPRPTFWTSAIQKRKQTVTFPPFTGERIYMQPFLKDGDEILIKKEYARWIPTLSTMLFGLDTKEAMFLMVDQSVVKKGSSHRRKGPHIDGNWSSSRRNKPFDKTELLILASDICGCVAYIGDYDPRYIEEGGDCSIMDLSHLEKTLLEAGHIYIGNVITIHESIPIKNGGQRTLVRINVPL